MTLSIRPRDSEEVVLVLMDLADVDDSESDDLIESLIFARVAELLASPRWSSRGENAAAIMLTV